LALRQQQEVSRNAELLQKLLDSTQLVQAMQQPIQATLERMTEFDRFQEAALSLTEAVMVLSTQLERSGHISRQAVRRRQSGLEADGMGDAVVLKLDSPTIRKAG
jgi:hypothetical protein